jgi:nicotinamidase-related amidase
LDVVEFSGPPKFNQTLWPDHCIQETDGAKLNADLKVRARISQMKPFHVCFLFPMVKAEI